MHEARVSSGGEMPAQRKTDSPCHHSSFNYATAEQGINQVSPPTLLMLWNTEVQICFQIEIE